ncbi:MAG: type I glyceraldehyde-3-phosphate dehydrogenase [Saprospiraceae bacterium]|uniref:Glyceraldehyde-3-phosphate dehydrogenase n=1 Tax=Candidatus Opimibacter skivensis TaxID=2982028 RepID=A0A9D7SY80_9BACT|nr:type I glyceraldehyde-3-phosphate dehydrogenase [Candidatus Opimibacter skivensis]
MAKRIAINGFGRIGRLTFRKLYDMPGVKIVGINDLTDPTTLAHLLKYDSAQGAFNKDVRVDGNYLLVDDERILISAIKSPAELWKGLDVDTVLECTGLFTDREKASQHIRPDGAKRVIISAPAKGSDVPTIVMGINEHLIDPKETVFSNASCTTNCLAPLVKILIDNWGIKMGSMITIHAYTSDQNLQDAPHRDLRRARAAAYNIIPTSTGAASALKLVIPEIGSKLGAMSYRVPVISGSIVDLSVVLEKPATESEINAAFLDASRNRMKGYLQYCTDPIVSGDVIRNSHSCVFDSLMTEVTGDLVKVVGWYDNEAGYSSRLSELAFMLS